MADFVVPGSMVGLAPGWVLGERVQQVVALALAGEVMKSSVPV